MAYVCDIQCFKSLANNYIMKEVCVVGVDNGVFFHCIVKPPTCYDRLSPEMKKRVDYVTKNIHGLPWDNGSIEEKDVIKKIRKILRKADRVYIKGSERVQYLRNILDFPDDIVIDLDIFDYRGSRQLTDRFRFQKCSKYETAHTTYDRCAVKKALTFRAYLLKHLERPV